MGGSKLIPPPPPNKVINSGQLVVNKVKDKILSGNSLDQ